MCWGIQGHTPTLPRSGLISRLLSRCTGLFYGGTVLHLSFWLHCYYFISKALLQLQHLLFFSYCKPPNSHLYTCSHMILLLLLSLLLSSFSRVRLCATPWTAAHPALPTLGFSREEMECIAISFSKAWKWKVKMKSPVDCSLPGSSIHGTFLARVVEWGAIAFSVQLPTQPWSLNLLIEKERYRLKGLLKD